MFWIVILLSILLLSLALLFMAIKVLLKKNGRFPNSSVSHNPEMAKRGITCATTFDRMEQKKVKPDLKKMKPAF